MKKSFKTIISVVLAIIMALSVMITPMAEDSSEYSINFDISCEKSKYNWNDEVVFNVTLTNVGENTVDYATIEVVPQYSKYFSVKNEAETVAALANGCSQNLQIVFDSECSGIANFFMPLLKLFGVGKNSSYKSYNFDETETVKVGSSKFDFGFVVKYGYENTPTGKEISNIKALNGGELPDIYMDDEDSIPSFIDGMYSNEKINNENDALDSLNDIKNLMGINDVNEEFDFYQKDSYDNNTFYRFQQYYNGIEVYGKTAVVVADSNRKASALSNDYEPGISITTEPTIAEEDAIAVVQNGITNAENVSSMGLRIYTIDTAPTLVYMISCSGIVDNTQFIGYVFVDAHLGYIIDKENRSLEENISVQLINGINSNVWKSSDDSYYMYDSQRNILAFNVERNSVSTGTIDSRIINSIISAGGRNYNIINKRSVNGFNNDTENILYVNMARAYDYYRDNYNRESYDGDGSPILLTVNAKIGSSFNNASALTLSNYTRIAYGAGYDPYALDVVVHEYTHSVESTISGMRYRNESGALMEAYSDIMGEVVENDTTWLHYTNRNLANPNSKNMPSYYKGTYWYTGTQDNGGVHTNNSVVCYAAYLMQQDKIIDMDRLGELWYRSLYYLDSTSNFADCRAAVIAAARDMRMSNSEIGCIQNAFEQVGIAGPQIGFLGFSSLSGNVIDANTGLPIPEAEVVATKILPNTLGAGVTRTDSSGRFKIDNLGAGWYIISVSASGYVSKLTLSVFVGIATDTTLPTAIMLDASSDSNGALGGRITSSVTGMPVVGATIKFRNNHGVTSGEYVKQDGHVVTLTTNENGEYSCTELKTGYYTMEVTIEGYITGYFDVIASPSNNICMNQNFSISPEMSEGQFRIELRWGADPRDLDSHLTGPLTDGSSFHIFYPSSARNAYDGNVHVANLDVDDTSGEGPETVTLTPTTNGTYRYYVHRFSGSGSIASSGATVKVYRGNVLLATYSAPTNQGTGDYWTVFEITNGTIKLINKIGSSVYTG
jgi:Zn-dependent metalloprotease